MPFWALPAAVFPSMVTLAPVWMPCPALDAAIEFVLRSAALRGVKETAAAEELASRHPELRAAVHRAVLLGDGALRREGTPEELRADAEVCERYLGRAGG